jgi:hypothetical protein
MSLELKGRIVQVLPLQQGEGRNGNPWKKQEYILEVPGQYPKKVCFNVWGDKVDTFGIRQDEELIVSFDVESREYNGRWYTEVKAWKVSRGSEGQAPPPYQGGFSNDAQEYTSAPKVPATSDDGSTVEGPGMPTEDLPF